ncbi:hypothetical protein [Neobacillus mesonae]|uniref:hypothetical protein n=1 Tax=Neobacillus mesonae TaxID=1193713 RepID=UPI00203A9C88|nr:hypothetical protein [Neobacillus mesonae]MCM3567864.1 hypothetical protein [Neobacillus mesonae]
MKIADHLSEEQKQQLEKFKSPKRKKQEKVKKEMNKELLILNLTKLAEALRPLLDAMRKKWNELKELFKRINVAYLYLANKPSLSTTKKLAVQSQVIIRKPLMARARSCC